MPQGITTGVDLSNFSLMSYFSHYVVMLDGAFVLKRLSSHNHRFPTADEVADFSGSICSSDELKDVKLLRIYYYDAEPSIDKLTNPVDQFRLDMSSTHVHFRHKQLLNKLELKPNFALRLGETATHGWKVGGKAMENLVREPRAITARDLVPNITQKGVDLRIGLDIARIAIMKTAGTIVAVTGDSDLIPAFKFARREGIRVFLNPMNHGVKLELKAHCDKVLSIDLPALSAMPGLSPPIRPSI